MTQYLDPAELYAPDEVDVTLLCMGDAKEHTVFVRTEPHREQPQLNEPWRTNLMLSQLVEPGRQTPLSATQLNTDRQRRISCTNVPKLGEALS